ncbi:hypothetical protein Bhyg_08095, partial [Pseudolycoriella hygida]
MKSNDESSQCGSSSTGSVVSGSSNSSSTFASATFKKPPRNIVITANTVSDQKLVKQKRRQQINENEREQQRLDLDVLLSGFPDKASKSQLFKTHIESGKPLRWNQISQLNGSKDNPIIKIQNRFSKFNVGIEKQLNRLRNKGIISEYKFKDSFYCYKQMPVSEWKVVSVEEDLFHLIDLLKYVK